MGNTGNASPGGLAAAGAELGSENAQGAIVSRVICFSRFKGGFSEMIHLVAECQSVMLKPGAQARPVPHPGKTSRDYKRVGSPADRGNRYACFILEASRIISENPLQSGEPMEEVARSALVSAPPNSLLPGSGRFRADMRARREAPVRMA